MKNNITTRQGDHGTTSLADGTIVTKNDQKIEACGTLDELNCHVGLLLTMNLPEEYSGMLNTIQRRLFAIGAPCREQLSQRLPHGNAHHADGAVYQHRPHLPRLHPSRRPSVGSPMPHLPRRLPPRRATRRSLLPHRPRALP